MDRVLLVGFHSNRIDVAGRCVEREENIWDRFATVLAIEIDLPKHTVHLIVLKQHATRSY